MIGKYFRFEALERKSKITSIISVISIELDEFIGVIRWHDGKRQYDFFPEDESTWNMDGFDEVDDFLHKLNIARNKRYGAWARK